MSNNFLTDHICWMFFCLFLFCFGISIILLGPTGPEVPQFDDVFLMVIICKCTHLVIVLIKIFFKYKTILFEKKQLLYYIRHQLISLEMNQINL